mgnify:CR=1 FL=1
MTELIIVSIIVLIALLYVRKTLQETFNKESNQCNLCHCNKCPYSQPKECPIHILPKCDDNLRIFLPKEINIDGKTKTIM